MNNSRYLFGYLTGVSFSLTYNTYYTAKEAYNEFHNKKEYFESHSSYSEETYMRHMILRNLWPNLLMAPIWPITLPINFIPSIVKYLNSQKNN